MQMLAFFNPLTSPPDEEDEEEGARPVPRRGAQPQRPHNGLHDAALWNNTSKMKKYLDSGAATVNDFAIGTQQTALMWAAQEGHAEAVQLLLSYGARPSVKDETGRTALEIAKRQNHGMVENILIEEEKRLKKKAHKQAKIRASREQAKERAQAEAATTLAPAEAAVRAIVWVTASVLFATGVPTWVSPRAGLEWYGYSPSADDFTNLPLVGLNGMARIVLGVALLRPNRCVTALVAGIFAWLPNYAALGMPPVNGAVIIAAAAILLQIIATLRVTRWPWLPKVQHGAMIVLCGSLFLLGFTGGCFPGFAAAHIYQVGVPLTRLGEQQLASWSTLAPLAVAVWLSAHVLDRGKRGPMTSGFAAVCAVATWYQWLALQFYLHDPVRESPTSDAYDATGFVAALVGFGALVALVIVGAFALGVRVWNAKEYLKRAWKKLRALLESLLQKKDDKQQAQAEMV